jgi:hypothetical protein
MPDFECYKGFGIHITLLRMEEHQYQPKIYISPRVSTKSKSRSFSDRQYFSTEEEAIQQGVLLAWAIIDGKVPGCSVTDL